MIPVFYSDAYVAAAYEFDTTRKSRWIVDSLATNPIAGLVLREPRPLTEPEIAAVHHPDYVTAVRTGEPAQLAESNGFTWDSGLWDMVCASNGGAVAAALHALEHGGVAGSLSSGLHHAGYRGGAGYCTFNGLALAARAAINAGAERVLVIDLDAHCGGGTFELLGSSPAVTQLDIAVHAYDTYAPTDRFTLDRILDAAQYLPTLRRRLDALTPAFDLVLYNAGMDPYEECSTGGRRGMTSEVLEEREATVFGWCAANNLPVAFVLAGGYIDDRAGRDRLVDLHRLTLEAAARSACAGHASRADPG